VEPGDSASVWERPVCERGLRRIESDPSFVFGPADQSVARPVSFDGFESADYGNESVLWSVTRERWYAGTSHRHPRAVIAALDAISESPRQRSVARRFHIRRPADAGDEESERRRQCSGCLFLVEAVERYGYAQFLARSGPRRGGVQDSTNLRGEKALTSFDAAQRLVVSYVVDLPFGKGKRFPGNIHGVSDKPLSGWSIGGVTTFQGGFPLALTTSSNLTSSLGGGSRPNIISSNVSISGSAQSRLNEWFNTAAFAQPAAFTFGSEARTDPVLRAAGIANYDFTILKQTSIMERFKLEFRPGVFQSVQSCPVCRSGNEPGNPAIRDCNLDAESAEPDPVKPQAEFLNRLLCYRGRSRSRRSPLRMQRNWDRRLDPDPQLRSRAFDRRVLTLCGFHARASDRTIPFPWRRLARKSGLPSPLRS
jgi:hypothetical protein